MNHFRKFILVLLFLLATTFVVFGQDNESFDKAIRNAGVDLDELVVRFPGGKYYKVVTQTITESDEVKKSFDNETKFSITSGFAAPEKPVSKPSELRIRFDYVTTDRSIGAMNLYRIVVDGKEIAKKTSHGPCVCNISGKKIYLASDVTITYPDFIKMISSKDVIFVVGTLEIRPTADDLNILAGVLNIVQP